VATLPIVGAETVLTSDMSGAMTGVPWPMRGKGVKVESWAGDRLPLLFNHQLAVARKVDRRISEEAAAAKKRAARGSAKDGAAPARTRRKE